MTNRIPPLITWSIFLLMAGTMSYGSWLRHHVFMSSFDFAIFAQAIWNTWHGSFLYSSVKGGVCLLGDHVSPFLVIFAPFFSMTNDPSFLLVFQAAAAASSVFPLYLIGRRALDSDWLPLIFVIAYALYAPLRNAIRFDFHPELFADPLVLWAFYFILKGNLLAASMFMAVVLSTKEIACGPVAMLGLWSWRFQKRKVFGLTCFLIAIGVLILDVRLIAPWFWKETYFYLTGNYLSWLKDPQAFLAHLIQPSTFTYLKKIFAPVAFFSFFSPSTLILTFPILFQNMAARNLLPRSTFFQYTSLLTPFVFISAIYGFRNISYRFNNLRPFKSIAAQWGLAAAILISSVLSGKPEWSVIFKLKNAERPHYEYLRRYLHAFPRDLSVRTHELFAPHVATRMELYIYENEHPSEGGSQKALSADIVMIDESFLSGPIEHHHERLAAMGYEQAHEHDGLHVYVKNGVHAVLPAL